MSMFYDYFINFMRIIEFFSLMYFVFFISSYVLVNLVA